MSVTEAPPSLTSPDAPTAAHPLGSDGPERPVFAARGHRRPLWLARISRAVALLVGLWVIALVAGALGLGRLPGVPDLRPSQLTAPPDLVHASDSPAGGRTQASTAAASVASDLKRIAGETRTSARRGASAAGQHSKVTPARSTPAATPVRRRATTKTPGRPAATTPSAGSSPAVTHGNGNGNGNANGKVAPAPTSTSPSTTPPGRSGTAPGSGSSVGKTKGTGTTTGTGNGHGYGQTKAPVTKP